MFLDTRHKLFLVLAGIFTISNVIRLTVYARQDELDIMRLVGATPAYVKGPFVVEVEGVVEIAGAAAGRTWEPRVVL